RSRRESPLSVFRFPNPSRPLISWWASQNSTHPTTLHLVGLAQLDPPYVLRGGPRTARPTLRWWASRKFDPPYECERRDSNPQPLRDQILSLARMPIPPLSLSANYSVFPMCLIPPAVI